MKNPTLLKIINIETSLNSCIKMQALCVDCIHLVHFYLPGLVKNIMFQIHGWTQ